MIKNIYYLFALLLITAPSLLQAQTERQGGFVNGSSVVVDNSLADIIVGGGFESGVFGGDWTEASTNFGTPICDVGGCGTGTGTGPNTGAFWTWFGGIAASEVGSVTQVVPLGAGGTARLSFFLETIICDSAADFMEVTVNGTQEFIVDGSSPACGTLGYALQTVNLDAYATLAPITLVFRSEIFANNGAGSNFFIDDVALNDVVLPVELVSFTGRQNGRSIDLAWTTSSETGNAGFELEHRINGSEFSPIQFVEGQGTTLEENNYSFVVDNLEPGAHSFRLKQIDFDGSFEYSKIIETAVTEPNKIWLDDVYPNPFNPSTSIRFMVPSEQRVSVVVFDSFGRQVKSLFNGVASPDTPYSLRFVAGNLPSGSYHILVSGQSSSSSKTVQLLK